MTRQRGFTLIELLVVISIIVLLIGILLPALMGVRRGARQQQNVSRLGSLVKGMALFGEGNNGFMPGLDASGLATGGGDTPAVRLQLLFDAGMAEPEDAVNPIDPNVVAFRPRGTSVTPAVSNFSFAMLDIRTLTAPVATPRQRAWSIATNPKAPLLSDRNTGGNDNTTVSSLWTERNRGNWEGAVAWGDLSVKMAQTHILPTLYPGVDPVASDNLFKAYNPGTGPQYDDAAMVYQNSSAYVNQNP